ncbi:uncharacterized protein LOC144355661, partial [Saccoglossus kowalevskii]
KGSPSGVNKSKTHGREKPIFDGKAPLVPVTAQSVMDIHQIDLIDMSNHPCERNGITYRYILTLEDIFSRFIFLRALSNKEPTTVAEVLLPIYNSYGPPRILQCDQGNEFKGDLPILCSSFNIRMIRSRSRHPQSQGKVERSHRTIKSRLRFDEFSKLSETKGIEWVDSVPACEQLYNNTYHQAIKMSPFEAFFARQNNKFSRQPDISNEKGRVEFSRPGSCGEDSPSTMLSEWITVADVVRGKALQSNKNESDKMVQREMSKHAISMYDINDNVLVKVKPKTKLSGKYKTSVVEGKVVDFNDDTSMYKIELLTGNTKWFSVSELTSMCRAKEKENRSKGRQFMDFKMLTSY